MDYAWEQVKCGCGVEVDFLARVGGQGWLRQGGCRGDKILGFCMNCGGSRTTVATSEQDRLGDCEFGCASELAMLLDTGASATLLTSTRANS